MKWAQVTCFKAQQPKPMLRFENARNPITTGFVAVLRMKRGILGILAEDTPEDRTCAQCRGEIDGTERLVSVSGQCRSGCTVCERFWLRALEEDNGNRQQAEKTHDLLARTGLAMPEEPPRGDGDLGFVFGRCRSGRRWFWFACTYGVGENRTDRGSSDSEEQTREMRHCDHPDRTAMSRLRLVIHGWASLEPEEDQRREASRQAAIRRQGIPRVIEYLYGRDRCGGDCNSIYRFRITKRTAKRIFYIRKGEYIDGRGRANRLRQYHFDG